MPDAHFVTSSAELSQCPAADKPEYAFIGRSNVGKSSLINTLTGHQKLAKTSSTPGKTQLINHFVISQHWYLVDLPGYGYAKVGKKLRAGFKGMIYSYLEQRESLICTFVLIDSRHTPQQKDLEFMRWLGEREIPFVIVFTKADKNSATKTAKLIEAYKVKLLQEWEELPKTFLTSAETGNGVEEVLQYIEQLNEQIDFKA